MELQKQIDRLLTEQASQWIEKLHSGDPQDQEAFCSWLRQSKLHLEEFLEVVAIDRALVGLDADRRIDVDALIQQMAPTVTCLSSSQESPGVQPSLRSRAWLWGAALAASVVFGALAIHLHFRNLQANGEIITAA